MDEAIVRAAVDELVARTAEAGAADAIATLLANTLIARAPASTVKPGTMDLVQTDGDEAELDVGLVEGLPGVPLDTHDSAVQSGLQEQEGRSSSESMAARLEAMVAELARKDEELARLREASAFPTPPPPPPCDADGGVHVLCMVVCLCACARVCMCC
eukprot:COSAG05_NODE_40_length_27088_cov_92.858276_2_plen_158_part_00